MSSLEQAVLATSEAQGKRLCRVFALPQVTVTELTALNSHSQLYLDDIMLSLLKKKSSQKNKYVEQQCCLPNVPGQQGQVHVVPSQKGQGSVTKRAPCDDVSGFHVAYFSGSH